MLSSQHPLEQGTQPDQVDHSDGVSKDWDALLSGSTDSLAMSKDVAGSSVHSSAPNPATAMTGGVQAGGGRKGTPVHAVESLADIIGTAATCTALTKTGVLKRLPSSADTRLRNILKEGDSITYRSSRNVAVFRAEPARFQCVSPCCAGGGKDLMTLNQLERHWGRGKARKAWQNMLFLPQGDNTPPHNRLASVWDMDRAIHGATHRQAAAAIAQPSIHSRGARIARALPPSWGGDWRKVRVTFKAPSRHERRSRREGSPSPLSIARMMCSNPGCGACVCKDCRPGATSTVSVKRDFWVCQMCRVQLGLPIATRDLHVAAASSTRSRRVTYAPA